MGYIFSQMLYSSPPSRLLFIYAQTLSFVGDNRPSQLRQWERGMTVLRHIRRVFICLVFFKVVSTKGLSLHTALQISKTLARRIEPPLSFLLYHNVTASPSSQQPGDER